jgi:hypothetical protein
LSTCVRNPYEANLLLWPVGCVAAGAGTGAIAGKSLAGAGWGLLLAIVIGFFMPVIIHPGLTSRSPQGRMLVEIAMLDGAFKAYKEKYGDYPPSGFYNLDDTKTAHNTRHWLTTSRRRFHART